MIETYVLLGTLGVHSIEDVKERKITVPFTILSAIIGILLHLFFLDESIFFMLAGMCSGMSVVALSKLTDGKIGMGDGFVCMLTGLYIGVWNNLLLLFVSFSIAGLFGMVWIVIKKKNKQEKLPFVPFLLASYIVLCFL